ncbi:tetratricopeptide repeat protein [Streptomyces sp. NPDC006173]|uniref:tetratricopeptide repeat protein n=1 Tax=Streptomyces sp. NPDC006173 TaxID=3155349 RepID=UPI0033DBA2F6
MTPRKSAALLREALTDCLQALDAGDHPRARAFAGRAATLTDGLGSLAQANTLLVTGIVDHAVGEAATAVGRFTEAAELSAKYLCKPQGIQLFLHARRELAALHRVHGRYLRAEEILHEALAIVDDHEPAPEDLALFHNEFGMVCKYSGNFERAAASYDIALTLLETSDTVDDVGLADIYHNIGGLAHARGDYAAAEAPARRAVAIRERALSPTHPEVAADRAALAPILMGLGRLEEAEVLLRDAMATFETAYGPAHYDYVIALGNLAALIHQLGRHETAEDLYQQTLNALEKSLGPEHPDLAPVLANLADLQRTLGNPERARTLDTRAGTILTSAVRAGHPTLDALNK